MGELTQDTIQKILDLKDYVLHLESDGKRQRNITGLCVLMTLFLFMSSIYKPTVLEPIIIPLLISMVFLCVICVSMFHSERSLNEFRSMIISFTNFTSEGIMKCTRLERDELSQFVKQSKRYIVLYSVVKIANWFVFVTSGALIVGELIFMTLFC